MEQRMHARCFTGPQDAQPARLGTRRSTPTRFPMKAARVCAVLDLRWTRPTRALHLRSGTTDLDERHNQLATIYLAASGAGLADSPQPPKEQS